MNTANNDTLSKVTPGQTNTDKVTIQKRDN